MKTMIRFFKFVFPFAAAATLWLGALQWHLLPAGRGIQWEAYTPQVLGLISGIFALRALAAAFRAVLQQRRRKRQQRLMDRHAQERDQILVGILVCFAQMGSAFTREKLKIMLDFFQNDLGFNSWQLSGIRQGIARAARQDGKDLDRLLHALTTRSDAEMRLLALRTIYKIVYADDPLPEGVLVEAEQAAVVFGVSPQSRLELERLCLFARKQRQEEEQWQQAAAERLRREAEEARQRAEASRQAPETASLPRTVSEALAVLGLQPGVSQAAIKRAYHSQCRQYHPDKVAHLGEVLQKVAAEKMRAINAAYGVLKSKN